MLDAVADAELWIWARQFGKPGSLNYVNIPDSSPIVTSIPKGELLPQFEYKINEHCRRELYFMVVGIYPPWSILVGIIKEGTNRKEQTFAAAQEAVRKDVERTCGVLISRGALLEKPCMT